MPEKEPSQDPYVYTENPLTTEQLLPTSASQQLFNTYTSRIEDFPGFSQRSFHEARADFEKTIIEANDSADIADVRMLLHQLVDPNSYEELKDDLATYWDRHKLESDLQTYSYCFLTNHRFFSDLPILSGIMREVRIKDPFSASRNLMVVGKMIPGMAVDILGTGEPLDVTPLLAMEARQIQTVPKLPDDATEQMAALRRVWNDEAKAVMQESATTPGNILYLAASGSHDKISSDKKSLQLQTINAETAQLLCSSRIKVVPLFFSCDSFAKEGMQAARPDYALMPPRTLHSKEEVTELMHEIAGLGSDLLSDTFPKGVHYEEGLVPRIKKMARSVMHHETSKE